MKISNNLRQIFKAHRKSILAALLASLIAGGLSSSIVSIINTVLNNEQQNLGFYGAVFAVVCILGMLAGVLSEYLLISWGQSLALNLRMKLCHSILKTPVARLQGVGRHRLYAVLTEDVESIAGVCQLVPLLLMNLGIVLGCLIYLGWLSWQLLIVVLITVIFIGGLLFVIQNSALSAFHRARDSIDVLFKHFRTLTEGIRELKMHAKRRQSFVEKGLLKTSHEIRQDLNRGMFSFALAEQAGNMLLYAVIGFIVFVVPQVSMTPAQVITGYTLGLLFMIGPLKVLLSTFPALGEGIVAFNKIDTLGFSLADYSLSDTETLLNEQQQENLKLFESSSDEVHIDNTRNTHPATEPLNEVNVKEANKVKNIVALSRNSVFPQDSIKSLNFKEVKYHYNMQVPGQGTPQAKNSSNIESPRDDEPDFMLGPIDFEISGGELVFVTGGNGSGKSTLLMLLVGLYTPQQGVIELDGHNVTGDKQHAYRQLFSVVFAEPYVFDSVLGHGEEEIDTVKLMLEQLRLSHKVHMQGEQFSTTDLSQGQRKRLALLMAWLDDRPIYVFDEWAAEQDPIFKKYFYTEFLPMLKTKGKTVFVITHDDQYFFTADRMLKLTDGKLVENQLQVQELQG